MNISSAAFAVVNFDGEQAEEKEEAGHSKADFVHCRVSHQLLAHFTCLNSLAHLLIEGNACFHLVSYRRRHHDTADNGHQDEVKRVHEAGAG